MPKITINIVFVLAFLVGVPGTLANSTTVKKDWASAEEMRAERLYREGFNIAYRSDAAKKTGSCIFLHLWKGEGQGTAGCAAVPLDVELALHALATSASRAADARTTDLRSAAADAGAHDHS